MTAPLRVMLAGAADTMPALDGLLAGEGVSLARVPLLRFSAPLSWEPFDSALRECHRYGALVVTSPRGADALLERVTALALDPATVPAIWTGSASAARLQRRFAVVRTPTASAAGGPTLGLALAAAMLQDGVRSPVLFPCGEVHRDEMVAALVSAGVLVQSAVAYRSELAPVAEVAPALHDCDVVVGTSPRVMQRLAECALPGLRPLLVAIGETSAAAADAAGWPADIVAAEPTAEAVVHAIHAISQSVP